MTIPLGNTRLYPIQVAEKTFCQLRVRVSGEVGHGSIPQKASAIFRLAHIIDKLRKTNHLPVHFTPTTLKMVDSASSQFSFPMRMLISWLKSPTVMDLFLSGVKGYSRDMIASLVSNTIFINKLQAGDELTPTPSIAEADFICGLVPGQTPEQVIRELQQITGPKAEIETMRSIRGAEFSTETSLYHLLEKRTRQMDPGGVVIPMLMPGITDASQYQEAGIIIYGFTPGILPPEMSILQLAHGHDERIPISFIETGLPVLWDVVNEFCTQGI